MINSVEQLIVMMNVITFVCTVAGVAALTTLLWMALRRIDQTYVEAGADPAPLLARRSDAPKP